MDLPFPLSNRIFVDARYIWTFPEKEEYVVIFSSKGNDEILQEYIVEQDISSSVVIGRAYMSAHWLMPIKKANKIVGTKIFYVN